MTFKNTNQFDKRLIQSDSDVELEHMVARRHCEILHLRQEVQRLQLTLQEAQESTANHISRLQQQLASKMEGIERLKAKLDSQLDYEKMKQELRTLRERKWLSGKCQSLSLSVPAPRRPVLAPQGGRPSQSPPDDDSVVPNVTDAEIKTEAEMSSRPCSSTEWTGQLSCPTHFTCATPPLVCPRCPSSLSTHDALPCVCVKTESSVPESPGAVRVNGCGLWQNDSVGVWVSAYGGYAAGGGGALGGTAEEGSFSEGVGSQINTAEVSQQVTEQLQKHEVSQSLFGRHVLGLWQERASEILAHPKPWRELTAGEKESFLRMINFLSDDRNVLALRLIQDMQQGRTSPVLHTREKGPDNVIKDILEQVKRKLQSQNRDNTMRADQGSSHNNGTYDDNCVGKRSEDIIKGILEQARREMEVQQDKEHQHRGAAGDLSMTSDPWVEQEEERSTLPHQDALSTSSPINFVQSIIRRVRRELGAEDTCTTSCVLPSAISSSLDGQASSHLPFSETNQTHTLSRKTYKTGGKIQLISVSAEKHHPGPHQQGYESFKGNWQLPAVQDGQCGGGCLSRDLPDLPDLCSRTHIRRLVPLYPELDTLSISRRVKDMLSENNLGQRLFGEKVLGLTQGSVSDLLTRPKPWSELGPKGREPFICMSLWLQDPQNVQCLKTMKRAGDRESVSSELCNMATRPRMVLTTREKELLNRAYQLEPYPSHHTTHRLALQLGLQPSTVTNWFYNHRSRVKRSIQDGTPEVVTRCHSSDPDSCFHSSFPCADTSPMSIKQELIDADISEVRLGEHDIYQEPKYVSTGVQYCRNFKLEKEEDS
ncbi:homeobox protein cut-like 2 [Brachyhypopomus gauderio]|uniref:homeobox protein cut-like 2 n=1 Tax=Brachyhypopomus gauderio TaxID=698409 RepID=UPI004040FC83